MMSKLWAMSWIVKCMCFKWVSRRHREPQASARAGLELLLSDSGCCWLQCTVRDLYGREDLGKFTSYFTAPILAHGAGVLKITPLE